MLTGRDVPAVEQDFSLIRRLEAGEHPQQRGLAAAGRSEQGEKFPGADLKRQLVDRNKSAEALGHAVDAQQRHVGHGRRFRWRRML
jgi:hypothetical protein